MKPERIFRYPILGGGLVTLAVFGVNELLMGVLPTAPVWWAIPYFPLRTVGIPLLGAIHVVAVVRQARRLPAEYRPYLLGGFILSLAVVVANWGYPGILMWDLWRRPV